MKKLIFSVAYLKQHSLPAQKNIRSGCAAAISPDGTTIAFAYKGDLYSVSVNGGEARQLTTHAAFDSHPVWSPDSKKIAFQSNREGSLDIFVIDAKGGAPTRLTTNSGSETPIAFADNDHVLYSASLQPTAQSIIFGDNTFPQVYGKLQEGRKTGTLLYPHHGGYQHRQERRHSLPRQKGIRRPMAQTSEITYRSRHLAEK